MKKHFQKFLAILLVLTMVASMSACGKKNDTKKTSGEADKTTKAAATPTEKPRDLGGMSIKFANWWETETKPTTQKEEDTQKYREDIQKKYNCKIKVVNLGSWNEYQSIVVSSIMAGNPAADVFTMDQQFLAAPLQQGLLYSLNTIKAFDGFKDKKWNTTVKDMMTFKGNVYGMSVGRMEPRLGIFFNKRLFEEAGLDKDLPYDLQKKGEWTWDKFEELCKKLTRDTNNDGKPDTYALASFSIDFFKGCVFSNNAEFIGKDKNGKFYNATHTANFLQALQWGRGLYDKGYEMPQPKGSNWDWFIAKFKEGKVAMQCAEEYKVSTWKEMDDDWGFVIFPKGPKGEMMTVFAENVNVMPAGMDAQRAENVAYMYNLWTNDTPGYENDTEGWKTNYYPLFRDSRAVDETLPLFYEPKHGSISLLPLVDGVAYGQITFSLDAGQKTPQEVIESASKMWKTAIDKANGDEKAK